jgi:hypothetical protein
MTPADARALAGQQAEEMVAGLSEHWLRLSEGVRLLILATVANPGIRSDGLLQLADVLDEFACSITSPNETPRRLAEALCIFAAALTALAPARA